ncbi:MAG: hypothetical protein IAE97_01910 [Chthoniobacterales bacterium]|nr:hypothetical protein [Chthoniobacterales bacterium]
MKHTVLAVLGAVVVGITCYLLGLAQGTNKGVKGSNADSLLFFIGIHRHLQAGQMEEAIRLSETAMASHAGVIQTAEDHPTASLVFLYPWMGDPLTERYMAILGGTHAYLADFPHAAPGDTMEFLSRYQKDFEQTENHNY